MADEDQGEAAVGAQAGEEVQDRGGGRGVESRGDFVAEQEVGFGGQGAGYGGALALSAGEFVGVAVGEVGGEADVVEWR
ncbi:hypothetical protein GCM10012285_37010 [Streptomyces kronopolitis]|uniref:Uncharacterized protein n=1 Tax=Streptomyces kronopolitis TaxID=1612435 RepID=A0ABQ2JPR2_9ACTN|nr:hypothetical protein GCM10012285_37010 [Streptomyces kronopolitis]